MKGDLTAFQKAKLLPIFNETGTFPIRRIWESDWKIGNDLGLGASDLVLVLPWTDPAPGS